MDIPDVPPPLPPPDVSLPLPSPDIPLPLPSPGLPLEWGKPNDVSGSTFIERAVQPRPSLHGRVEGKRSRLDEQPELPHRGGFTSTIEHDNVGASTDPEIRTNLDPIDEGYASFAPNDIVSDRSVCQLLRSGLINQPLGSSRKASKIALLCTSTSAERPTPPLQSDEALACQVQTSEP
ncbi:hypothetical protein F5882DRAFT_421929 [Hyaloscypha sp. PMI_1271]|nr:hypothetical protein F5882DRAFT_421929 [Hyaloscypha sp. PMI_1271]